MFEPIKYARISQNIVEQIRNAILNNNINPGDRLPSEKELASNFGVSKASVREALRSLEALGLVEIKQGVAGGAFVREIDYETAREGLLNFVFFQDPSIRDFTQVRSILEPKVVEIIASKITDQQLSRIEKNLEKTKESLDSSEFFYGLDISFHKQIVSVSKNSLLIFIVDSMQNALLNIKTLLQPDLQFSKQVYYAHKRIYDALCTRDPQKSSQEMINHIQEVEDGLLALSRKKEKMENNLEDYFATNNIISK